jgi:hypothetical protein
MAFSYGRQFRRIAAQALTADPDEMRALIARILPVRDDGGAPQLRLETQADCQMAPAAIVAAFFADLITGDQAAELLAHAMNPATRKQVEQARGQAEHPLAEAIRAWREGARWGEGARAEKAAVQGDRLACGTGAEALRDGAQIPGALVKNNENTSAAGNWSAAGTAGHPSHPP